MNHPKRSMPMGNTNLPQFGAADTRNGRDTLSGDEQLTDEQRRRRSERDPADAGPAPGRPKNAPKRVPGQHRDGQRQDDGGDRTSVGQGKSVSVRVGPGGGRIIKKNKRKTTDNTHTKQK